MICAQDTWHMLAKIQEQQHLYCPDESVTMDNSCETTLAPNFYHLFSSPAHLLCTIIPQPPPSPLEQKRLINPQHPHLATVNEMMS